MRLLMMTLFAAAVTGCGTQPEPTATSAGPDQWTVDDPRGGEVSRADQAESDVAPVTPEDDAVSPRANCSIVQFCNAPGSDGTRCIQQGCDTQTAENECFDESFNVCGTPLCPWIFVTSSGTRLNFAGCQ